jgi:putative ABC transport system permease protein
MFDERDHADAEKVVPINQAMADRYFADEDPIGQRIAFDAVPDSNSVWRTIVGVVGNVRQFDLRGEAQPEFIAPATQDWGRMLIFVVRSAEDPTRLVPAIRSVVREMDAGLPIFDIRTLDNVRATAYARERFVVALFTGFAVMALLLAVVGVYGIAAQAVRTRTHEIGIRMALGADRRDVFGMVVWRVMRLVIAGVAIGLAAALAGTRMLDGLLFGVTHTDAATFTAAALTLAATALLACTLPARRATKADPILALRGD